MIEYIAPMDTSELASGDNIHKQKERTAFNKFKKALVKKDRCWNCFNLSHCTGFNPNKSSGTCDTILNDSKLLTLYNNYKYLYAQRAKITKQVD